MNKFININKDIKNIIQTYLLPCEIVIEYNYEKCLDQLLDYIFFIAYNLYYNDSESLKTFTKISKHKFKWWTISYYLFTFFFIIIILIIIFNKMCIFKCSI